jgi:hypothetical protein
LHRAVEIPVSKYPKEEDGRDEATTGGTFKRLLVPEQDFECRVQDKVKRHVQVLPYRLNGTSPLLLSWDRALCK